MMYCDQTSKFMVDNFWVFNSLLEFKHENIQMRWVLDLNLRVQHLFYEANGQRIWEMHQDLEIIFPSYVIENVFVVVKSLVKNNAKVIKLFHSFLISIFFPNILFFVFLGM